MITISLVIPVYAGADYLEALMAEIETTRAQFETNGAPYRIREVIFVDDGARDASPDIIDRLGATHDYVVPLHLSRNFGQHPATVAGILHSSGDWVVTLDEDLQHPPSRIPDLLGVVADTGADIVYGRPAGRVHESFTRDFSSRQYKFLIERLTGNKDITKANSFRLVRGSIARAAASICAYDTYFDVALSWFTQRIHTRDMELKDVRFIEQKKSSYNLRSLMSHARRLAFSSQIKLLRLGAALGLIVVGLALAAAVVLIAAKLIVPQAIAVQGWTSLMLAICFFSGAILFVLGIILEYLSILVMRAHGRPPFYTVDRSSDAQLRPATE